MRTLSRRSAEMMTALRVVRAGALSVGLVLVSGVASAQRPRVISVELYPAVAQIRVGQQQVLLAYAYDAAHNTIARAVFRFSSSNLNVAVIDMNGIAVAIAPGVAIITARTGTGAAAKSATAVLTVIAGRQPDTTASTPTAPSQPAQPRGPDGTLSLVGNIPRNARVTVDGRSARLLARLSAGRHRLRVEADGFERYEALVDITAYRVTTHHLTLLPTTATAANCANPQVGLANRNSVCWDVRPAPRMPPAIQQPASCTGTATPASVLLRVSASGDVETTSLLGRSNCAAFGQLAVAFALDMAFSPATKNGRPVAAWIALPIRPLPR